MKTFFTLSLHLLITSFLLAQAPQGISYQAVKRNADGTVMANSAVDLTFMIHDASATGNVVYQESHALTSNAQGLVSCVVGNGVVSQGNFANINWGSGAKFLHVMMGTTDLGTQQMLSVPYALHANGVRVRASATGDTLTIGGNSLIVPGISAANYPAPVLGCTNAQACNYNGAATQDDGSCLYPNATCYDGDVNTTNDVINSECVCAGTILPPPMYTMGDGVTDFDGNFYPSILINGQEWMQQNLAVTKYRNGDPIPTGLSYTWQSTTGGAYAIYNNDAANNTTYGKLYNWYAVNDSRGLCPTGWHVPSDAEWSTFINYLDPNAAGGDAWQNIAGGKMKSTGTIENGDGLWYSPNEQANNESGFSGLPGGYRASGGTYALVGNLGGWWSSTENDSYNAWHRSLLHNPSNVNRVSNSKHFGFSVRCVRDTETSPIQGCTDGSACNFLANATQDDGSCLYPNATCDDGNANTMNDVIDGNCTCTGVLMVNGCTNAQACNYNPSASVDNGSCLIQGASCNDGNANTTNDLINANCECAGSATGNGVFVPGNGVTDIDGTVYTSIVINGQEWMQQNLAVTKYRNGDPIPTGLSDGSWSSTTNGAYAIYDNVATNNTTYGKLYNWYAVNDSRGLCPTGWHVPSDAEWTTLEVSLGGSSVAGGKMKSTTGWTYPNTGATNESGFTGLPGGYRTNDGAYYNVGYGGEWWSSTEYSSNHAWYRTLFYFYSNVDRINYYKRNGFGVRCVRD